MVRWRRAMAEGLTAAQAARAVGVSRATLYRWEKRPELRSRRPRRVRGRRWPAALIAAVETLRADNPVWGKRKLGPLLRAAGHAVSDATVGRILAYLVRLGRVVPAPLFLRPTQKAAQSRRRWAKRLRGALKAERPGQAVQLDTLALSFGGGHTVKQFTAVDRASRWSVAMAAHRATAASAARFLDKLLAEAPFPVEAIQIDGGSEFMAEFEAACEAKGLDLWVLPPRSPEMNGRVERMQSTWRYEFYAVFDPPHQIDRLNPLIDAFAHRYNTYRPHNALDGATPAKYLESSRVRGAAASQMN